MKSKFILLVFLIKAFCGCKTEISNRQIEPHFKTFEISFNSGWNNKFSFAVDSNGIYLSKQRLDSFKFGIVPDSILKTIDSIYLQAKTDSLLRTDGSDCPDCPVIAIQAVKNNDTVRITQYGPIINRAYYPLVNEIQRFLDKGKHQNIKSYLYFETESITSRQPPSIDN